MSFCGLLSNFATLMLQDKWTQMSSCTQWMGLAPPWHMLDDAFRSGKINNSHDGKEKKTFCVRAQM